MGSIRIRFNLVATALLFPLAAFADTSDTIRFNRQVLPILSDHCFQCHGPDEKSRAAGLRLDLREEAIAGGAFVPGNPDASTLIARTHTTDPDDIMPPAEANKPLSGEDRAILTAWIAQGAEYEPHWAYTPVSRPDVPEVSDAAWVRNPIDAFILARLEKEGVTPSPEADPVTLARRAHFDLVGLPPNAEALARYIAPDAYEDMVEDLFVSPHYGERMAVDWLDQVRYADTNGYHSDEFRSVWPYRDYVIDAFNENKPFDQFTREQLAGDLLPDATEEQRVASGFNRMNPITAEGGAQAKEYLAMYMADRIRATGSVWMGATLGCAECHDHKFDPYTMEEFYSLGAFFADIEEPGVYPGGSRWEPVLELPTDDQQARLAAMNERIRDLNAALNADTPELREAQTTWEEELRASLVAQKDLWQPVAPREVHAARTSTFAVQEDASVFVNGPYPEKDAYTVSLSPGQARIAGIRLEALHHPDLPNKLSPGNGNFILTNISATWVSGEKRRDLNIVYGHADYEQESWPVAHAFDENPKTGWAVSGHEDPQERTATFVFSRPVRLDADDTLELRLAFEGDYSKHAMARFRIAVPNDADVDLKTLLSVPGPVKDVLRVYPELRTEHEARRIAAFYRSIAPELDEARREVAGLAEEMEAVRKEVPYTLITRAREPRTTRVLPRGNWMDESGAEVTPALPAFLPALDTGDRRATRLDLAEWLISRDNPLTARVIMNRTWATFFGTGLSKELEDLGLQGEPPSHPDLLDWLATEFMESGWDFQHMVRLMVTSNTYRQSSAPREDLKQKDPFNRLLARQPRMRLEAEVIRDTALAVSGLLAENVGGPSVFPYQPDGYWANCNTFRGPLLYTTSEGDDQYRRGLYTVWKRSFLHPSLLAFDAPNREECIADRVVSNTPLQSLVLLNDPTYVEAARALGERILLEAPQDDAARIAWAFKTVLSREPRTEETALVESLLDKHRAEFATDKEAAEALLSVGQQPLPESIPAEEIAAWTSVARVLLNLHETITRT